MLLRICLLSLAWGSCWMLPASAFGEPRIVPNFRFGFQNDYFDQYPSALVVRVLSGNRLIVQVEGEPELRIIRLAGIEALSEVAPEFDNAAIEYLQSQIQYRTVKLEGDLFQRRPDGTGSVEAYVWLEGQQLNEALVRDGLAIVERYTHNLRRDNTLRGIQAEAQRRGSGVWGSSIQLRTETQLLEMPN